MGFCMTLERNQASVRHGHSAPHRLVCAALSLRRIESDTVEHSQQRKKTAPIFTRNSVTFQSAIFKLLLFYNIEKC